MELVLCDATPADLAATSIVQVPQEDEPWAVQITHILLRHLVVGYLMVLEPQRSHHCVQRLKKHGGDAYFLSLDSVLGLKVYRALEMWGTFEAELLRMVSGANPEDGQLAHAGIALALEAHQHCIAKDAFAAWLTHHPADGAPLAAWFVSVSS